MAATRLRSRPPTTIARASRRGTINAHDGRTRIAALRTIPVPIAMAAPYFGGTSSPRTQSRGQPRETDEHQRDEQPFGKNQFTQPIP